MINEDEKLLIEKDELEKELKDIEARKVDIIKRQRTLDFEIATKIKGDILKDKWIVFNRWGGMKGPLICYAKKSVNDEYAFHNRLILEGKVLEKLVNLGFYGYIIKINDNLRNLIATNKKGRFYGGGNVDVPRLDTDDDFIRVYVESQYIRTNLNKNVLIFDSVDEVNEYINKNISSVIDESEEFEGISVSVKSEIKINVDFSKNE